MIAVVALIVLVVGMVVVSVYERRAARRRAYLAATAEMRAAIERISREIGEALLPVVVELNRVMAGVATAFYDMAPLLKGIEDR